MKYKWNHDDEEWDGYEDDNCNTSFTFDPEHEEYYWEALNSETVVIRPWNEWQKLMSPMTSDDILDTHLFIKRLP